MLDSLIKFINFDPVIIKESDIPSYFIFFSNKLFGLMLFPFIFIGHKKSIAKKDCNYEHILNHEKIHFVQCKETFVIGFYTIFIVEFLCNLLKHKDRRVAYSNVRFEKEAYGHMNNMDYLKSRKSFSWLKYTIFPDEKPFFKDSNDDQNNNFSMTNLINRLVSSFTSSTNQTEETSDSSSNEDSSNEDSSNEDSSNEDSSNEDDIVIQSKTSEQEIIIEENIKAEIITVNKEKAVENPEDIEKEEDNFSKQKEETEAPIEHPEEDIDDSEEDIEKDNTDSNNSNLCNISNQEEETEAPIEHPEEDIDDSEEDIDDSREGLENPQKNMNYLNKDNKTFEVSNPVYPGNLI